jgi:Uma2 family endonuclease
MAGLPRRDGQHHNYGDYLTWSEDVRYELIDGAAFLMSPGPDLAHQDFVGEIFVQVSVALRGKPCRAFVAPLDVILPRADEPDEQIDAVVQPDLMVVCDEHKLTRRGVRGAPDWVVEVISPATASHDQVRKRRLYERAGVREFWLVHPTDRVLTVYKLLGAEYGKPDTQALEGVTPVGVLPGVVVQWDEIVARHPNFELQP